MTREQGLTEDQKRGLAILRAGDAYWKANGTATIMVRLESQMTNPPPFSAEDAVERNLGKRA